jgi:WhiB family redox-sensing transcriptional regulator
MDDNALRTLAALAGREPDWTDRAACRGGPVHYWFPEGQGQRAVADAARGKAVCSACPVRQQCLAYGMKTTATGIFGGHYLHLGRY